MKDDEVVDLDALEEALLELAEGEGAPIALEEGDDNESPPLHSLRADLRGSSRAVVVWEDGLVQIYADGGEDKEEADEETDFEAAEQVWHLLLGQVGVK